MMAVLNRIRLSMSGALVGCALSGCLIPNHTVQYACGVLGFILAFWSVE